ncbi:hypothetical protein M413DRAFT_370929 [Hebeloma cylindrosporum]|uniref:Uncharacterized protein n=1 Tax=Hebeloma cylindrosporum TaxID=76867 RepID=A0A0C2YS84_HEBCY|nr:hypothetical protein M413DRAFT_370929 [Hebeloma cylindrosporum h7]
MAFLNLTSQIGTNYIPSEEELDHIKNSLLPVPTDKLASLEIEINRAYEIYSSLLEQRQALLDEIQGYRGLISPARRLPVDVLQEVFLHTLPTSHNAVIDPQQCPILLTRICRGWRSIALSTPQLWSSIHIPVPHITRRQINQWGPINFLNLPEEFKMSTLSSLKNYATIISNWLGRSGASPLSITLHDAQSFSVPKEHYEIIIDSFLPFANLWKNLILDTYSLFLGPIAELTASDVPILESLALHDLTSDTIDPDSHPILWKRSGLVRAPSLKRIDYTPVRDNLNDFSLKWGQLTDIKLWNDQSHWGHPNIHGTLSNLVLILSLCPRLINFHAEIRLLPDSAVAVPSSISSLSLPNLQKLVYYDAGVDCRPLFELLDVPSLLHLKFFPYDHSSQTVLPTFLPHVASTLLSLSTYIAFFVDPNHFPALTQCQKLTSIIIPESVSVGRDPWAPPTVQILKDILLDNMTLPSGHPDRLAPALEHFECWAGGRFSDAALLRFIKAKQSRPDIATLKKIFIAFTVPKETDIFLDGDIARYVADGLSIVLRYPLGLDPKEPFEMLPAHQGVPRAEHWAPESWPNYYDV